MIHGLPKAFAYLGALHRQTDWTDGCIAVTNAEIEEIWSLVPVGTRVALKFSIIMDDIETVEGVGEVVRVSHSPSGMGVVFTSLTSHSMDLLGKLLTRALINER